jgi:hypothetical protein
MAATVGDLAVRVGANTENLERGMAKASRSVKNFSASSVKRMRKVATASAKMGAAAVAAGVAMTAAIVAKQSKVIDSLAKTADALNLTTESLQALNHLAELNGVSSEGMAKGLRKMEVNLGMAARTGGASARALEDLGISLDDIIKLSPDKQLQKLSDAIAGVENQSMKASIATDIFGRDGVSMLKVLNQIEKDGIDPTVKKLKDYGVAITRIDAAQVEAANDAFLEAQTVIEGLGNTLTVQLAPFITELSERFVKLSQDSGGFGGHVEAAVSKSVKAVGKLADFMHGLRVAFKGVELVVVAFGAAAVSAFEFAAKAVVGFVDLSVIAVNSVIETLNQIPGVDILKQDLFRNSDFMRGLTRLGDEARNNVGVLRSELHNLAMQPMPSAAVDEFLEAVKEKSVEAAQVVSDARDEMMNPVQTDMEIQAEQQAQSEELLRAHIENVQKIHSDSNGAIQRMTKSHWGTAGGETVGAMKSIVGTMAAGSKKAFQISKAWAIADALISTFQGMAAGVRLGFPMAIPAVAWAAATGFAQLSNIKNQQFGGSGGAAASGGGAPAQAPNPVGVGGAQAQQSQTLSVDSIDPNAIFSGASMQAFGERIHEFSKDGGQVVFGT